MIITRQFSIRSGSPDKGGSLKRELAAKAKAGAIIGGVSGGIIGGIAGLNIATTYPFKGREKDGATVFGVVTAAGTIIGALAAGLGALGANSRKSRAEEADMNTLLDYLYNSIEDYKRETRGGLTSDVRLERYIVEDQDPNKFMVNFAYENGNLIINLNKPTNSIIESLDESLEEMIKFNRKGDYTSQQINNGFIVYVVCPSIDAAAGIIYNTIEENHIKVNAITQKLLSKVNKKQKEFNSKAQKALRQTSDLIKGVQVAGERSITSGGSRSIKEITNELRSVGRRANRYLPKNGGVNASINKKAEDFGSFSTFNKLSSGQSPLLNTLRGRIQLGGKKAFRKKTTMMKDYDHGIMGRDHYSSLKTTIKDSRKSS